MFREQHFQKGKWSPFDILISNLPVITSCCPSIYPSWISSGIQIRSRHFCSFPDLFSSSPSFLPLGCFEEPLHHLAFYFHLASIFPVTDLQFTSILSILQHCGGKVPVIPTQMYIERLVQGGSQEPVGATAWKVKSLADLQVSLVWVFCWSKPLFLTTSFINMEANSMWI